MSARMREAIGIDVRTTVTPNAERRTPNLPLRDDPTPSPLPPTQVSRCP
jgi:hypothetical protein